MVVILRLIMLLLVCFLFASCEKHTDHAMFADSKLKVGDEIEWAKPEFQDSSWANWIETKDAGVFWERMPVEIPDHKDYRFHNVIMITAMANFDAYFDGVYLGNNFELEEGSILKEAGNYQTTFLIPDSLNTLGPHLLAMRFHRIENVHSFHSRAIIGNHRGMLRVPLQVSKFMFLFGGIYLIIGVFYLLMFTSNFKDRSLLVFGFICLLYFALIMFEYLKLFHDYPYTFQVTRLKVIAWLNMAIAFFVPFFFSLLFSFPWKKIVAPILMAVILILYFYNEGFDYDQMAKHHNMVMWIFSFIVVGFACLKKQKYALIVLTGLIIGISIILWLPRFFFPFVSSFDISLFASFTALIMSVLIASSLKRKTDRKAYEESLLQSEKLKNELLKKNIRPHFIMNTLTSLMDWVEESPKEGVKFIGSLAEEFEILNEIADHKLVPIEQEVNLCKNHLDVMAYRKEVKYIWEEEGLDYKELIPPAIIHTAVENGITHTIPNEKGEVKFRLSFSKEGKVKTYVLETFGFSRKKSLTIREGTGSKYIKSRLSESYGKDWEFESKATDYGWENKIKIKA